MSNYTRLTRTQIDLLLQCIAEGLKLREINDRMSAAGLPPVKTDLVSYYRSARKKDIATIIQQREKDKISTGLATKEGRVAVLITLAEMMIKDLTDSQEKKLWLSRLKGLGQGFNFRTFEEEEFNNAEISQLRGILEDIAKEMGGRSNKVELSTPDSIHVTIRPQLENRQERLITDADEG